MDNDTCVQICQVTIVSKVVCPVKMNAMNHHANIMQATYIWGSAMEKVMEGKEVNSMKENVDDAIAFESDSPVRNLMMQLFILSTIANLMVFSVTFVVITMTVLQAFYTILGAAIFSFLGLLIYAFINGGLRGGKKIKEDAKDTSVEDSE